MKSKNETQEPKIVNIQRTIDGNIETISFQDLCDEKGKSTGQFYVSLPTPLEGHWTTDMGGVWVASKKVHMFSSKRIREIEKHLELEPGQSGILNPDEHYEILFRGSLTIPKGKDGLKMMKSELSKLGIKFSAQGKKFNASVDDIDKVREIEKRLNAM